MSEWDWFFVSSALHLLFRINLAFRLKKTTGTTSGDESVHLLYCFFNKNNKSSEDVFLLDTNDYPQGFHKFVLFVFRSNLILIERYGMLLPLFFDFLLLFLATFCIGFLGGEHGEWLLIYPVMRIFLYNEGRSSHFSERAFGVFWGNLFLFSCVMAVDYNNYYWILPAFLFFSILSISSKFSWQAVIFILFGLCLVRWDPGYILILILSISTSCFITTNKSLEVLAGLVRHSYFYKTDLASKTPGVRNYYKELSDATYRMPLNDAVVTFMANPLMMIIHSFPIGLLSIYCLFTGIIADEVSIFVVWVLISIVLVILISTNTFSFLGEPYRYMEYAVVPAFIVSSFLEINMWTGNVIIIASASFIYELARYRRITLRPPAKNELDFLDEYEGKTILTIPLRISFLAFWKHPWNRFVTLMGNIGEGYKSSMFKELVPDFYPYPGSNMAMYIEKYALDYLLVDKLSIPYLENHTRKKYYDFSRYKIGYENERYVLYKCR